MVSRIKIRIHADGKNINLPAIPFSFVSWGSKVALKFLKSSWAKEHADENRIEYENDIDAFTTELSTAVIEDTDDDANVVFGFDVDGEKTEASDMDAEQILEMVVTFIKLAKPILKDMDPFVLVEVQTRDEYVKVEVL